MLLSVLALIAATATAPQTKLDHLTQDPAPQMVAAENVTIVYLGCQIRQTALAECQVVNNDPVEPGAAAEAMKLAAGMSVPQALADRLGGHIVVKLNVKQ
ncbi:MAG: hypothetical protein P4L64_09690 [Caulobacteraceae bacterium]|nr:hypothetical protein [Caulobacteraceae bacterium]